jgi:hypothetical protein
MINVAFHAGSPAVPWLTRGYDEFLLGVDADEQLFITGAAARASRR